MPQKFVSIFKSVIPTGDLALFSRHAGPLVGRFARITLSEILRNLKSATVKITLATHTPLIRGVELKKDCKTSGFKQSTPLISGSEPSPP